MPGQHELLQAFADAVLHHFAEARLLDGDPAPVKLHVSLIRTRRKGDGIIVLHGRPYAEHV